MKKRNRKVYTQRPPIRFTTLIRYATGQAGQAQRKNSATPLQPWRLKKYEN